MSKNRNIFDAELILRNDSDAAETANADESGVAMNLVPQHPDESDPAEYIFEAVFHGLSIGGTTAAPTSVDFVIDVDSETAFGDSPVEVARVQVPGGTSLTELVVPLNQKLIADLDPDAAAIRCGIEITGGTGPTVGYGCYLTKA